MDAPSATIGSSTPAWIFDDAGLDALMLDLELLTALVSGPVRHGIERDRAA